MIKQILNFFKKRNMLEQKKVVSPVSKKVEETNIKIPFKSGWYRTVSGYSFLVVKDSNICYVEEGMEFELAFRFKSWGILVSNHRILNIREIDFVELIF